MELVTKMEKSKIRWLSFSLQMKQIFNVFTQHYVVSIDDGGLAVSTAQI